MGDKSRSVFDVFFHFHLLITSVSVECLEDLCVAQGFDTFVHSRDRVAVTDGNGV